MELIADILLVAGALGAGLYCFVLSRRLRRFTDLERGVGGAVAVLSSQADELKKSLDTARSASDQSGVALEELTQRAETVAGRLELMMASMHDVVAEEEDAKPEAEPEPAAERPDKQMAPEEAGSPTLTKDPATSELQPKRPQGLMFVRHGGKQNGTAV